MKTIINTIALTLVLVCNAPAERDAPPKVVSPVKTDNAIISAPHGIRNYQKNEVSRMGGVLEAHHPTTKELLWRIQVYDPIDQTREEDPHVFIRSLSFDKIHNLLILSDELERVYVLDLKTKKVTQINNT
jgi:hypothetical protein